MSDELHIRSVRAPHGLMHLVRRDAHAFCGRLSWMPTFDVEDFEKTPAGRRCYVCSAKHKGATR